jgi:hypothetical protein
MVPWGQRVSPPCITNVQAVALKQAAAVEGNVPIVAEMDECVVQHLREPRAMLAHGTRTPILSDGEVGVLVHVHLKKRPQKHYKPQSNHPGKINTETGNK